MKRRLLYISYWGINDPLTTATVIPNLKILQPYFSEVFLATIERAPLQKSTIPDGVIHIPYISFYRLPRILQKTLDLIWFSIRVMRVASSKKVDRIICRGAMAAAFGILLNRTRKLSFIVESFEPHADYMVEGGTWNHRSIEFKFQKWVEKQTLKKAFRILPVSSNYATFLTKGGIQTDKVVVMPCCVDLRQFAFDFEARKRIRQELQISDKIILGIYVGKFGDIYLDDEAFQIFNKASGFFQEQFFLIILTPQPKEYVKERLSYINFNEKRAFIAFVEHTKVPEYLSASDFAFSLIRPSKSRRFCSPIKNGEYWANGLPVLQTSGIGDDDEIIRANRIGDILNPDFSNAEACFKNIGNLIGEGRVALSHRIAPIAQQYRSFSLVENEYAKIMKEWLL